MISNQLNEELDGIIPRAVHDVFNHMNHIMCGSDRMKVSMSYLEIYNEEVLDLLGPGRNLRVRQTKGQGVYVEGLTRLKVKTVGDMLQLIQIGAAKRKVRPEDTTKP